MYISWTTTFSKGQYVTKLKERKRFLQVDCKKWHFSIPHPIQSHAMRKSYTAAVERGLHLHFYFQLDSFHFDRLSCTFTFSGSQVFFYSSIFNGGNYLTNCQHERTPAPLQNLPAAYACTGLIIRLRAGDNQFFNAHTVTSRCIWQTLALGLPFFNFAWDRVFQCKIQSC